METYELGLTLDLQGMFRKVIHGEWIPGYSAMGCPSYGFYGNNPRYLLEIRELTTLRVRLQANKIQPVPSINVAIYEKHPTELFGQEMATSGPYTNVVQVRFLGGGGYQ